MIGSELSERIIDAAKIARHAKSDKPYDFFQIGIEVSSKTPVSVVASDSTAIVVLPGAEEIVPERVSMFVASLLDAVAFAAATKKRKDPVVFRSDGALMCGVTKLPVSSAKNAKFFSSNIWRTAVSVDEDYVSSGLVTAKDLRATITPFASIGSSAIADTLGAQNAPKREVIVPTLVSFDHGRIAVKSDVHCMTASTHVRKLVMSKNDVDGVCFNPKIIAKLASIFENEDVLVEIAPRNNLIRFSGQTSARFASVRGAIL